MQIRPHRREDADRIAEILANGWAQAYAGFMPPALLGPRSDVAHRRAEIADWLDTDFNSETEAIFVAEASRIDGFIHMELGDKGGLGATGIVNLLYVDRGAQRRGIGRALLTEGVRWFTARAPGPLVLSAYERNPFRDAYAAMGGREAGRYTAELEGHKLDVVLYFWDDPRRLVP